MTKHLQSENDSNTEPASIAATTDAAAHVVWSVKREAAEPKPTDGAEQQSIDQRLQREWGGEAAVRRYCTAAAAKMLAERLGDDLREFLALADKADPAEIIDLLRGAVQSAATRDALAAPVAGDAGDEPPLPFVNAPDKATSRQAAT